MGHRSSTDNRVWWLLALLQSTPCSIDDICHEYHSRWGHHIERYTAHWYLGLLRNEYGDDVVITDWRSYPPRYRTAADGPEALFYVARRTKEARIRLYNTEHLAQLGIDQFGYAPLVTAQANLDAAVRVLTGP